VTRGPAKTRQEEATARSSRHLNVSPNKSNTRLAVTAARGAKQNKKKKKIKKKKKKNTTKYNKKKYRSPRRLDGLTVPSTYDGLALPQDGRITPHRRATAPAVRAPNRLGVASLFGTLATVVRVTDAEGRETAVATRQTDVLLLTQATTPAGDWSDQRSSGATERLASARSTSRLHGTRGGPGWLRIPATSLRRRQEL